MMTRRLSVLHDDTSAQTGTQKLLDRHPTKNCIWQFLDRRMSWPGNMQVMGILNVTPDSFYDGGKYIDVRSALSHGIHLAKMGADIIDVGGQSSRPYSQPVPIEIECERVIPLIKLLKHEIDIPISIDTYRWEVARQAIDAGAHIINDISALRLDPRLARLAGETGAGLILMHMRGTPINMQVNTYYEDLFSEVLHYLRKQMEFALSEGVSRDHIVVDPGIGFSKNVSQNQKLISELDMLFELERPVLLGPSRKSFIGELLGKDPEKRLTGTLACVASAFYQKAHIVRVHDVEETVDLLKMLRLLESNAKG